MLVLNKTHGIATFLFLLIFAPSLYSDNCPQSFSCVNTVTKAIENRAINQNISKKKTG